MNKLIMKMMFILIAAGNLYSQVNVNVIIRRPTPSLLSQWISDPTIVNIIVMNTSRNEYTNAVFSVRIKDSQGRIMLGTKNFDPLQPRFNIKRMASTFNGKQIMSLNAVNFDNTFKTKITTTNMIPEGDYELCVDLLDNKGNSISTRGEVCVNFLSVIPDPPILVSPFEGDSVKTGSFPQFIWSPVTNVPPGMVLRYRIKIAPIYKGQSSKYAFESNQLVLNKIVPTSSYQYLPSDKSFSFYSDAIGFAWQVTALDQSGKPATRNEGKSELRSFIIKQNLKSQTIIKPNGK